MTTGLQRPRAWAAGLRRGLAAAAAVLALPGAAIATHLDGFVWTFPQAPPVGNLIDGQWTYPGPPQARSPTSSLSGRYLGNFAEHTVMFEAIDALQIIALQADRAYLSFDLIMTGAWFGSSDPGFETFFEVVANGKTVFDATVDNLFSDFRHFDLIFDFTPFFPNCCTDVDITLSATFGPGYDTWEFPEFNPTWGIDNFVVSSTPIPEPATGGLVGLGLLLLAARKRRRGALL